MVGPIARTLLKHRLIFICVGILQCPYFCQGLTSSFVLTHRIRSCSSLSSIVVPRCILQKEKLFPRILRSHGSHFVIHGSSWHKVTSVSQQKTTLFFCSRSSSSFVALNTTSVRYVRAKNDVWLFAFPFWDGGIK